MIRVLASWEFAWMIKHKARLYCLVSLLLFSFCHSLYAAKEHNHSASHSDDLLFLLGEKLAIKKLQAQFNQELSIEQKTDNLKEQKQRLNDALPVLNEYMSRAESRYPNMQMYHDSLKSRGVILSDFSRLINGYFQGVTTQSPTLSITK